MRLSTPPAVYAAVAVGAAAGGVLRYGLALSGEMIGAGWPWPTLVANATGSLIIGLIFGAEHLSRSLGSSRRVGLVAGFCGGLTTFSIFSLEVVVLCQTARMPEAAAYLAGSLGIWLFMVSLGYQLGRVLDRRQFGG